MPSLAANRIPKVFFYLFFCWCCRWCDASEPWKNVNVYSQFPFFDFMISLLSFARFLLGAFTRFDELQFSPSFSRGTILSAFRCENRIQTIQDPKCICVLFCNVAFLMILCALFEIIYFCLVWTSFSLKWNSDFFFGFNWIQEFDKNKVKLSARTCFVAACVVKSNQPKMFEKKVKYCPGSMLRKLWCTFIFTWCLSQCFWSINEMWK